MSNSNNFAGKTSGKEAYEVERMKQEASTAREKASSTATSYVDKAKATGSDVVASAQNTASDEASQVEKATEAFQSQAAAQTNAAADEGQKDVEAIKTTTAGYVDQAKDLAWNAISAAQGYISSPKNNSGANPNAPQPAVASSLQSLPGSALETSKTYLTSAQQAIQPHVQAATETVQPYLESAQSTVQPHLETAAATAEAYAAQAQSAVGPTSGSEKSEEKNSKP